MARAGLVARGLIYGVIGLLAIEVATGSGGSDTNQQGALQTIAREPFGKVLLAAVAVGLAGYALWRLTAAVIGRGRRETYDGGERVASAASGIAYAALCVVAVEVLAGAGSTGGAGSPKREAAGVLGWPAGPEIVGAVGAVLVGVGLYQAYKGLARKFLEEADLGTRGGAVERTYTVAGVFGHVARGVVFVLVGYGLVTAAVDYEPSRAIGLDGALNELAHSSYGPLLLGVVAAGLIGFGLFSVADARYHRI